MRLLKGILVLISKLVLYKKRNKTNDDFRQPS